MPKELKLRLWPATNLGATLDFREGKLKIGDAVVYGVSADVNIRDELQGEFFWIRQDTEITLDDRISGETRKLFDAAVEYFHVGALYLPLDGPLKGTQPSHFLFNSQMY